MLYSQSPPLADDEAAQYDQAQGNSHGEAPRSYPRDAEPAFGRRPPPASFHALPPSRPSLGKRMFRSLMRFVILVGIGVGGTLGWQAYGDMGKQMLVAQVPEYAWVLSYLPSTRPPAAVAAAASPSLQLEPLASNVDLVRRSVEQMALKQEQMIRNIAALQMADEDIKQKISSSSPVAAQPAPAQPVAAVPPPKPAPPRLQPPPGAPAPRPSASAAPVSILPR
jgi:hypothetical protein